MSGRACRREAEGVARDLAVREELAHLVERGVRERQDELRRLERVGGDRRARLPDQSHRGVKRGMEGEFVTLLDGRVQLPVHLGELRGVVVAYLVLAFAENPDDHHRSPVLWLRGGGVARGAAA